MAFAFRRFHASRSQHVPALHPDAPSAAAFVKAYLRSQPPAGLCDPLSRTVALIRSPGPRPPFLPLAPSSRNHVPTAPPPPSSSRRLPGPVVAAPHTQRASTHLLLSAAAASVGGAGGNLPDGAGADPSSRVGVPGRPPLHPRRRAGRRLDRAAVRPGAGDARLDRDMDGERTGRLRRHDDPRA